MKIQQTILSYINTQIDKKTAVTVDRALLKSEKRWDLWFKKYREENHREYLRHMTDLKGYFEESLRGMKEMIQGLPTGGKIREHVQEESRDMKNDLQLIKTEVGLINKRLTKIEDVVV